MAAPIEMVTSIPDAGQNNEQDNESMTVNEREEQQLCAQRKADDDHRENTCDAAGIHGCHHKQLEKLQPRRGMKPRSQRNRKRPRSEMFPNENLSFVSRTCRLELDGNKLLTSGESGGPLLRTQWIRTVEPYPYTFATFAKARWIGRSVLDVYHSEFGSYPKSYYESAISQGRIMVSDERVDLGYKIQGGDILTHTVHRHEPAVAVSFQAGENDSVDLRIVEETDDLVVVDKPGTLPVHPCGGYHMNSLLHILEPHFGKLYNVNRLDRLTSGLVIVAKSSAVAQEWGRRLMTRDLCDKIYLARVKGKFPLHCPDTLSLLQNLVETNSPPCRYGEWAIRKKEMVNGGSGGGGVEASRTKKAAKTASEMKVANALGYWIADAKGTPIESVSLDQVFASQHSLAHWLRATEAVNENDNGELISNDKVATNSPTINWFHLACPTRVANPKDGICEAGEFADLDDATYEKSVKAAQTAFGVVRYDVETDSTVVVCRPVTGRTHQIRLHLQFLGHPIANDPNYGGDMWYGDPKGLDASQRAQLQLDSMNATNLTPIEKMTQPLGATSTDTPATEDEMSIVAHLERSDDEPLQDFIKRTCVWCARSRGGGNDRTMLEFLVRSRGIWLHALKYSMVTASGTAVSYRTEPPHWI